MLSWQFKYICDALFGNIGYGERKVNASDYSHPTRIGYYLLMLQALVLLVTQSLAVLVIMEH